MKCEFQMSIKRTPEKIVLVLDDDPQICLLMERCLRGHFDTVLTATDPNCAHQLLEEKSITHVLADLRLGGQADGTMFLVLWKREFPCIKRAVIFTAADVRDFMENSPAALAQEIDAIVSKLDGIDEIITALLGSGK